VESGCKNHSGEAIEMSTHARAAMLVGLVVSLCTVALEQEIRERLVSFIGAQKTIFATGKADAAVSLESLKGGEGVYAVGPAKGLNGEITVFNSRPYITRVSGASTPAGYTVQHSWNEGAIFLVWTHQQKWRQIAIPETVTGYLDLQKFVKAQAEAGGIDSSKPFPFLLSGIPAEVKWHINVDRSAGKPITPEIFAKSKASYVSKAEPLDVIGFYSEQHAGIFITPYTPAIQPGSGQTNAMHMHLVSRQSEAVGHIDDIKLGAGIVLRLPLAP
jgi:acetolactate decarboxylase